METLTADEEAGNQDLFVLGSIWNTWALQVKIGCSLKKNVRTFRTDGLDWECFPYYHGTTSFWILVTNGRLSSLIRFVGFSGSLKCSFEKHTKNRFLCEKGERVSVAIKGAILSTRVIAKSLQFLHEPVFWEIAITCVYALRILIEPLSTLKSSWSRGILRADFYQTLALY